jgi:hypothetical protein
VKGEDRSGSLVVFDPGDEVLERLLDDREVVDGSSTMPEPDRGAWSAAWAGGLEDGVVVLIVFMVR